MKVVHGERARTLDAGKNYRVVRLLGEGGFGTVYEAVEVASGQKVALKALTRAKADALSRFKREFRALSEVSHVNLVGLRELYEHGGLWLIAMELLEGLDLLTWIRSPAASANDNGVGFDEDRLRSAFADVAQGLCALHGHGLLHCDLKPSNVRVTREGRAVLLDFGLVAKLAKPGDSTQRGGTGTVAYMAPEQATSEMLSPAVDWYAFGTCLYEALTGHLPFEEESPFGLLLRKTREEPLPPRHHCPGIPRDLDELCMGLLARSPEQRLGPSAVLAALGAAGSSAATTAALIDTHTLSWSFEGRADELARLSGAMARTRKGELSLVLVEGESGIGKSALVRQFVQNEQAQAPQTWLFSGRCYEHERVPYKAFDGCMDGLAKALGKLPSEMCTALLPRRAGLLAEIFPALRGVRAIATASLQGAPLEPAARRFKAFQVLAELLGKLAEERPILFVIDDLQWADQESFRLLRALFDERPPVALTCTVRPERELSDEVRASLEDLRKWPGVEHLEIRGLDEAHSRAFARQLLGPAAEGDAVEQIVREGRGHPMLIGELVRYVRTHGFGAGLNLTLDAALSARIAELSPFARGLLEVVALSGRPRTERVFEGALRPSGHFGGALKELLAERLVRRSGAMELTPFHDRIRAAALRQISPERLPRLHLALAEELTATGEGDAAECALHWDQAGQGARARGEYVRAAEQALESLAFARSAELYTRALELHGPVQDRAGAALVVQRGHALARSGRSAEAAAAYLRAAEHAAGEERTLLRVLAAQHQMQGAQIQAGKANARAVLAELGVTLPESSAAALGRIAWERVRLAVRGLAVKPKAEVPDHAAKQALDVTSMLVYPLGWAEILPFVFLNICYVRRALDLGDPGHAARALAQESGLRAILGDFGRATELMARAWPLAMEARNPAVEAYVRLMRGGAFVVQGECATALADFEAGQELLVTACPYEPWLLTNVRMALSLALHQRGDYRRLAHEARRWLAEAHDRSDAFAPTALLGVGQCYLEALMRDAPDEPLDTISRTAALWPREPLGFAHMGELSVRSWVAVYQGRPDAHHWFKERAAEHNRAFIHRAGSSRDGLMSARAMAALAAYPHVPAEERPALLAAVDSYQRKISRARAAWSHPVRGLFVAQVAALRGRLELARATAEAAHRTYLELGMLGFAHGAGYFYGSLEGGENGANLREAAISYFRSQGWKDPWRGVTSYVPAARALSF